VASAIEKPTKEEGEKNYEKTRNTRDKNAQPANQKK